MGGLCDGEEEQGRLDVGREKPREAMYKVLLIGDSAVGKSCMILRIADNQFSETYISTIGVDFKNKEFMVDGRPVKLQIWDTAGQERFRTITSFFFHGAHAIILVYDITSPDSFNNIRVWLDEIKKSAPSDVKKILVGNKIDLEAQRQIDTAKGDEMARVHGMPFIETSAKSGANIAELFKAVAVKVTKGDDPRQKSGLQII